MRKSARLALLQQITHSIGSRHDLKSIFQVVLRSLEEHLPIDFGCVCLRSGADDSVSVESVGASSLAQCESLGLKPDNEVPIGRNGLYRAMNGTLIHEPDTSLVDSPFTHRFAEAGLYSLVIAPLMVESSVFGVLIAVRRERQAFSSGTASSSSSSVNTWRSPRTRRNCTVPCRAATRTCGKASSR